jgi:ATP-binding cassette subfamily C protein
LDNITQAKVCESLERLKITRVVIAHRLSTVRTCDRIIVLDKGRIVEEGTFDTLMAQSGQFYSMASRQLV